MIEKTTFGLKWNIALWFAVFLVGTLLNLWGLGHESIWLDEAFTMFLADNTIPEIARLTKVDTYFPLWFIALRLTIFIGGTTRPSWKISLLDGEIELGTRPPTSMKWMKHQP